VPHARPISFFSILSPAQYWVISTNHLAPRYAVSTNKLHKVKKTENKKRKILTVIYGINSTFWGGISFHSEYVYNMADLQFFDPHHFLQQRHSATEVVHLTKAVRKEFLIIFSSENLRSALLVKSCPVSHCYDICLASLFVSSKLLVFLTDVKVSFLS
jgi:hypothetical protein